MAQNSVLITKWGTGSNASPTTLYTGELAINVDNGTLFYGSASVVKTITASYAITAAFALNGGGGGTGTPGGALNSFQYNAGGGNFGGASSLTYVSATQIKASGSFTGSFVGNLTGTSSYVSGNVFTSNNLALSSSYAITASYALNAGGTPGGLNTQIQFNSSSTFSGSNSFAYIYASESLQQGETTLAIGTYSHAEGQSTTATGGHSHAEGGSTLASGIYSHAEGGSTSAIGEYSHAEGANTTANGDYSHAEGTDTIADGYASHAEGRSTTATGYASHAEGHSTAANGDYSHAEGYLTTATGFASHAEGVSTTANGDYSHAEGYQTTAIGEGSHAEGYYTVASGSYQHVQGQYNISSSAQSAFIIGNGVADSNRSNLVFASGSTFQVTGSINLSGSQYFSTETDAGVSVTGQIGWNTGDQTLDLGLSGSAGNIPVVQIGQQDIARVFNAQGTTLTKGQVVYISGSQGNRVSVKLAAATSESLSFGTLGFVLQDIANGSQGYVATRGPFYKVDTTGYTAGALLYLSSSAGQYTETKPPPPFHQVRLGFVERIGNANQGSIYIKIDNGYEIDELHDVYITSSNSGDLLVRSSSLWINSKQLTGSYALTGSLTFTSGGVTGSLFGTSSWAVSSSRAVTASYVNLLAGPNITINYQSNGIAITGSGGGGGNSIGELTGDVTAGPASSAGQSVAATLKANLKSGSFGITMDGAGGVISTGQKGYVTMPYSGSILSWTLLGDQAGSCNIDITKSTFAGFPTQTSITGSAPITSTSVQKATSATLTGWTSSFDVGDVFGFTVNSLSGYTRLNLFISTVKF